MKKKILLLFVIGLFLIVGCGKKVVKHEKELSSFFYSYNKDGQSCTLNITINDNKILLNAYGNISSCNINEIELEKKQLNQLIEIIKDNKLEEWNGFSEQDEVINNGNEFSIQIGYDNGERIFAYGYRRFPDNYLDVHNKLVKFINEIN